jgi:uncharacterized protein YjdB
MHLRALRLDGSGRTERVKWSSSDKAVVWVGSWGKIYARSKGTATITTTSSTYGDSRATVTVGTEPAPTSTAAPVLTTVTVAPATQSVTAGGTAQLTAVAKDQSGNTMTGVAYTWASANAAIATVDASGLVTGVAAGEVAVAATSGDRSGSSLVTVTAAPVTASEPAVTAVTLAPSSATLTVGATQQLTTTVKDQNGNTMTGLTPAYQSSNAAIATVSSSGLVSAVAAGQATITSTVSGKSATSQITVSAPVVSGTTPPPVAKGIWISKAELDALPMSGSAWTGSGEVKETADAAWTVQGIEVQASHVFNLQAMAGALVFARMYPDRAAETYRLKVVQAIRNIMAVPDDLGSSATAPNRNLGTWAIIADLINLPAYDPALDTQFRAWLVHKLDVPYQSGPKTIRLQAWQRPNNQGSWASYSLAAVSAYIGDQATLNKLAIRMRRYFGDLSAPHTEFVWRPQAENTFQVDPSRTSTWVGINPKGATRDGHHFDGIQPEDQGRGSPVQYDPADFPNNFSAVRYNEVSMKGLLGAVLILHRAGYRDLLAASDQALLRAAQWMKWAADTHAAEGYRYFTDGNESPRPLLNYFYGAGLPETRARSQLSGGAFGYTWTWWTHAGRRVN